MFKLIRDNVPELIKSEGKVCNYAKVENEELYESLLKAKLVEEVNSYLETNDIEKIADAVTVISALVDIATISKEEYQKLYQEKLEKHGGYEKRYLGFFADPVPQEQAAPISDK